jgi:cell division protease FtsH
VNRVTIVPRGQALGVTYQRPDSDRYNYPEAYLRARIVGMLGARAAEEIVYGTKTTGAESDIEQATGVARRMVTRCGMSDRLGLVQLAPRENQYLSGPGGYGGTKAFSDETAEAIDNEVLKIINESHEEAKRLLTVHSEATRRACGSVGGARDAQRAGDPRGHGSPARAAPGYRDVAGY